jgi:hypothetical protein
MQIVTLSAHQSSYKEHISYAEKPGRLTLCIINNAYPRQLALYNNNGYLLIVHC